MPPLRDRQVDSRLGLGIIIGKDGSGKTHFMRLVGTLADLLLLRSELPGTLPSGVGCFRKRHFHVIRWFGT